MENFVDEEEILFSPQKGLTTYVHTGVLYWNHMMALLPNGGTSYSEILYHTLTRSIM